MHTLVYAASAGLTALVVYLLVVGERILLPFVIAIFTSYLISALATAAGRIQVGGRPLPRTLRILGAVLAVTLILWLTVRLVVSNVNQVMASAPMYEQNLQRLADRAGAWAGLEGPVQYQLWFEGVSVTGVVRNLAFGLTGIVGSLGAVAIYVLFLLLERRHLRAKLAALFPDPARKALAQRILHRIGEEIETYIWLKTLISAGTAVACYVVMKLVGLDLAEFWALLIFGLNFIPYIGSWLGVIFPAFLAMVQFDTLATFLLTTIGLTVVQFTGGSIIEPRLMGTGLNLSPVVMLLSLATWGAIWGVVGMFLAVPLMVIVMIVCSHFEATRPIAVLMSTDGTLKSE